MPASIDWKLLPKIGKLARLGFYHIHYFHDIPFKEVKGVESGYALILCWGLRSAALIPTDVVWVVGFQRLLPALEIAYSLSR